jgi:hypothetical protein
MSPSIQREKAIKIGRLARHDKHPLPPPRPVARRRRTRERCAAKSKGARALCVEAIDQSACLSWVDTVEKGIFRNLEATLIQDRKPTRNLDSKIHMAGFVRFKF